MKHDKDAIDHSFGGPGIPTRDRSPNLRIANSPPRPWAAMLNTWNDLLESLVALLTPKGEIGPLVAVAGGKGFGGAEGLRLQVWRWMWSLPLCSEARKAAFTLGHAAYEIERWRVHLAAGADEFKRNGHLRSQIDDTIGQHAEALLRIAKWHIERDARGEADGQRLHGAPAPSISPHERVYTGDVESYTRAVRPNGSAIYFPEEHGQALAEAIVDDWLHVREALRGDTLALYPRHVQAFAETAIASLPVGPWVMTSEDVSRFLDMILEDAPPRPLGQSDGITRVHVDEGDPLAELIRSQR